MSGYQFYEFQAIDAPLSEQEQAAIDALSSRVELSANRAAFVYHYGDLRARPMELLAQYFDAYLYVSNWGTKQLAFRFPANLIDTNELRPFELEYAIEVTHHDNYVILDMKLNDEEGGGWIEDGEHQLSPYLGLRSAILDGDYRGLYIAWLGIMEHAYEVTDEDPSPPIPDGLNQLDNPLRNTRFFFEADPFLLQAAAKHSHDISDDEGNIRREIANLPIEVKDDFLIRLAKGESLLQAKLLRQLKPEASAQTQGEQPLISQLREDAAVLQEAAAKAAVAEAENNRVAALEELAQRENQVWSQAMQLIEEGRGNAYKNAVALLVQLRDLALHRNEPLPFEQRISHIRQTHQRRKALIKRLNDAQL